MYDLHIHMRGFRLFDPMVANTFIFLPEMCWRYKCVRIMLGSFITLNLSLLQIFALVLTTLTLSSATVYHLLCIILSFPSNY